ncbi:Uncharacterised protein [Vibrio cholerae]|uniref:Uncharacterized protein n=1 Tax=Vibrio cholerae TaxID=666 RepID=A0A655XKG3_VIBCL|nr:Uncharacterised protein [Vibrio cholerae]CSI28151.1 Uncharacterised protein [Vibrio cholerae]
MFLISRLLSAKFPIFCVKRCNAEQSDLNRSLFCFLNQDDNKSINTTRSAEYVHITR